MAEVSSEMVADLLASQPAASSLPGTAGRFLLPPGLKLDGMSSFDGDPTKAEAHMQRFETMCALYRIEDLKTRVLLFAFYSKPGPRSWFDSRVPDSNDLPWETWPAFKADFFAAFPDYGKLETVRQLLKNLGFPGVTVQAYTMWATQLRTLLQRAPADWYTEHDKVCMVQDAVTRTKDGNPTAAGRAYTRALVEAEPSTLLEALEVVRKAVTAWERTSVMSRASGQPPGRQPGTRPGKPSGGQSGRNPYQGAGALDLHAAAADPGPGRGGRSARGRGRGGRGGGRAGAGGGGRGVAHCYRCGSSEHMVRDCPNPVKCFNCGANGHTARECPNPKTQR